MKESSELSNNLNKELNYYLRHLESLYSSLPLILMLINATKKTAAESFNSFLNSLPSKDINEKDGVVSFNLELKDLNRFEKLQNRLEVANISENIIPSSFLISLVSHFDAFLGSLIRNLFIIKPERLNSSEKKLSYSELFAFENIELAKENIIEKEVESVLRESHSAQIKWLEERFDIKLRIDLPSWPNFIEITERRNLFVHADGKVNSQYIKICSENNYLLPERLKIGDKLNVDLHYFNKAFEILFELGVKLTHVFWSKYLQIENEKASSTFVQITYDLICNNHYSLAINLLEFAIKYLKNHSDYSRKVFRINLAQAYKWSGDKDNCVKILSNEDWSACEPIFKLGVAVLSDNFEMAIQIMGDMGPKEEMISDYQTWPLFKVLRKDEIFLNKYKEIYNKDFVFLEYRDELIKDVKLLKPEEDN